MKKADIILVIFILVLAGFFLLINKMSSNNDNMYVIISVDGQVEEKFLHKDMIGKEINIDNKYGHNKILISKDGVKMEEADCNDQICVDTKEIKRPGQAIVCLPHRLEIKLVSDKTEVDAVVK